jgi:parallel beta-helix repeat protein
VYDDSSPYSEQLIIRKSINLLGENKLTTKIGKLVIIIIDVKTDNFKFSGFTVQGGEIGIYGTLNNSLITDNIFSCYCTGIGLDESSNNIISNNMFNVSEQYGSYVIGLFGSDSNTISNNIIKQGTRGLWLYGAMNNRIYGNIISDNTWQGINMSKCFLNFISKNNFINNANQVTFEDSSFNLWWRNFWDDCSKSFLYPITGTRYNILTETTRAWTTYDWIPSSEPYDIEVGY